MVINWYGEACFKIQSGETVLLTDPFDASVGLTTPRLKPHILLKTMTLMPLPYARSHEGFIVHGAGEYEVHGVEVTGWELPRESGVDAMKTFYRVRMEDITLGFLGHMADVPDAEILERMGDVDILFLPAGGAPHLDQEKAVKLARQLNAKIVITSLFRVPGLTRKAGEVKGFLDEIEQRAEPQEKLVVKKQSLPPRLTVHVPKL